jgi:Domain of unknown function (DUF6457)
VNANEWLAEYAARLGTAPLAPEEFAVILELAGAAAHSSERVAAPAATWIAARSGRPLDEALEIAQAMERND